MLTFAVWPHSDYVTFKKYHTSAVALKIIKLLLILCNRSINEKLILSNFFFKFGQLDFFFSTIENVSKWSQHIKLCVSPTYRGCSVMTPVQSTPHLVFQFPLWVILEREKVSMPWIWKHWTASVHWHRLSIYGVDRGWRNMEKFSILCKYPVKKMPVAQVVMNVTTHFKIRLYWIFWWI